MGKWGSEYPHRGQRFLRPGQLEGKVDETLFELVPLLDSTSPVRPPSALVPPLVLLDSGIKGKVVGFQTDRWFPLIFVLLTFE